MTPDPHCAFCAEIARHATPNLFYDELGEAVGDSYVLDETRDYVVMPSIGALVPGYCLILPKAHVRSVGHLAGDKLGMLIDLLDDVATQLVGRFGDRVVFYEHGPVAHDVQAGSCADHAHVHVVPVPNTVNLTQAFRRDFAVRSIDRVECLRQQVARSEPYLLLGERGRHMLVSGAVGVVSQYFRRQLAAQLGKGEEWDWVLYPQADNVRATIERYPRRRLAS